MLGRVSRNIRIDCVASDTGDDVFKAASFLYDIWYTFSSPTLL